MLAEDADSETGKYIAWGMFGTGMAMIGTGRIWATSRARYDSASLMKVKNLVAFFSPISIGMVVIAVIVFLGTGRVAVARIGVLINVVLIGGSLWMIWTIRMPASRFNSGMPWIYLAVAMFGASASLFFGLAVYGSPDTLSLTALLIDCIGAILATFGLITGGAT